METLINFLKEINLSPETIDFYYDFFELLPAKDTITKQKTIDLFITLLKKFLEIKPQSEVRELLEIQARSLKSFVLGDLENYQKAINDFFSFLKSHTTSKNPESEITK